MVDIFSLISVFGSTALLVLILGSAYSFNKSGEGIITARFHNKVSKP